MKDENELLFSMATIFRIESIKEICNDKEHMWCVRLITVNHDDDDINALLNFYKQYIDRIDPLIVWAKFLSDMGEYSKSEYYYKIAVDSIKNIDDNTLGIIYNNIGATYLYRNQPDSAFEYYILALNLKQKKSLSLDDQSTASMYHNQSIAASYQNIAHVFHILTDYQSALENYRFSLDIKRRLLDPYHLTIATTLNNIGMLHNNMKEYLKALEYYNEAFDIYEKILPKNHPEKAILYKNIGDAHHNRKDYPKASEYYHNALEIGIGTLPAKHQSLAEIYRALAKHYLDINDLDNALENYLNAISIAKLYFDSFHSRISDMYNSIGFIYSRKNDFSKALEYYHLALQMNTQRISIDCLDNVNIYNSIA
jgi:tetratricopeptide (TPR) repeat protein